MNQDHQKEIAFFNHFTKDKDYDSLTPYGYQSISKAFQRYIKGKSIHTAVDLGCGTGSFTRLFFNPGIRIFGVDISYNAIERAHSKSDGINYFVSDITSLGIRDESMDLVIFSGVLHHFPDNSPCLREAQRILKKGGIILSYDPHINNPAMWLYRHPGSPFFSKIGKTDNEKLLSKEEMKNNLIAAGFNNIQTSAISGVTISYLESPLARLFLPFYNLFEYVLGFLPVSKKIGSFLICFAEKE